MKDALDARMVTLSGASRAELGPGVRRRLAQVLAGLLLYSGLLFAGAGRLSWGWAWVLVATMLANLAVNALVMPVDLIVERGKKKEGVESWDRVITRLSTVPSMAVPFVAGVDSRFHASPSLPIAWHLVGLTLYMLSQGLFTWAMVSNRFFSTAVRLQFERGHTVETGGPYRVVRHPGYVGAIGGAFATALVLGSVWALLPASIFSGLFVIRTALEDRTLRRKLPGYDDYAGRVRYRLLPGIW